MISRPLRIHEPAHLPDPAIARRREAEAAFETPGKMKGTIEATVLGNSFDRSFGISQHPGGPLKAGLDQPGFRSHSRVGLEQATKIIRIKPASLRPRSDGNILTQSLLNPFLGREHMVNGLGIPPGGS